MSAERLGGLSGYLGTIIPTVPITVRRDGSFGVTLHIEVADDQIRKIEEHCNSAEPFWPGERITEVW